MDLHLRGKRVLITGASKGIGAAAAEAFAEEGCDVMLAARNGEQLKALAERLRSAHQIGATAQSFRVPYASHGGGPVQLNLMACLPNALYLETGLIAPGSRLILKDGCALLPDGPGFGWE